MKHVYYDGYLQCFHCDRLIRVNVSSINPTLDLSKVDVCVCSLEAKIDRSLVYMQKASTS